MHPRVKPVGKARGPNCGQMFPNTLMCYYAIMSFWPTYGFDQLSVNSRSKEKASNYKRKKQVLPPPPRFCGSPGDSWKPNKRQTTRGYWSPATGSSKGSNCLWPPLPWALLTPTQGHAGTAQQGSGQAKWLIYSPPLCTAPSPPPSLCSERGWDKLGKHPTPDEPPAPPAPPAPPSWSDPAHVRLGPTQAWPTPSSSLRFRGGGAWEARAGRAPGERAEAGLGGGGGGGGGAARRHLGNARAG